MRTTSLSLPVYFLAAITIILFITGPAHAIDRFAQSKKNGFAIKGYDTTAYQSTGKPRAGAGAHVVEWKGATWRFATAEDAALFEARPDSYAPQFGGYCTRAMSKKIIIAATPTIWRIHEGKLYMFYAPIGLTKFNENPAPMIAKAQTHWDTLNKTE
ncbi:MAG: YHS domain-containing (seleno)protein [Hyphomicrobiaceae bacterium]